MVRMLLRRGRGKFAEGLQLTSVGGVGSCVSGWGTTLVRVLSHLSGSQHRLDVIHQAPSSLYPTARKPIAVRSPDSG